MATAMIETNGLLDDGFELSFMGRFKNTDEALYIIKSLHNEIIELDQKIKADNRENKQRQIFFDI